jgi:hypothetical protein
MEDFLYLLLIFTAICIAVMVIVAGFVVAATVASVCVFGAAAAAFSVTMYRSVVHRGGVGAAAGPGEPSFRAYYRGQVWSDLRLAAVAGWTTATAETARIRTLVPTSWDPKIQTLVRLALTAYSIVGLVIGALLAAAIGIVPAIAVALFAAGAWALGAPLRGLERLRRKRTGAYFDCQECHDRFPLPQYVCPTCDARHSELAPGPFGVLRHRCTCGARLPAVQFRGRERLLAECPQGHPLGEGVGTIRTFHVPVAGGPSTGKSTYLAAALIELDEAAQSGTLATTVQSTSRQAYDRVLENFRKGIRPPKTDGIPPAMVAEISGRQKTALLYAYDVAGEIYGTEDELRRDPAHGLAEGVILLVDPFALDRVKTDLQDDIDRTPEIRPSVESPQRMLERLIGVLEEQGVDLAKISAAVCVTKIDALGIGEAIAKAPGARDHERTRAWLEQEGAGNFLRAAEGSFRDVQCFGVSALGRTPGAGVGAFVPQGAAAPLLWLLGRAGIEPAAAGAAAADTQSTKIAAAAPLDVAPKRPLYTAPLDAVGQRGYAANFGIGLLATGALALALLPFAGTSSSSASGADPSYGLVSSSDDGGGSTDSGTDSGGANPADGSSGVDPADDSSGTDPTDNPTTDDASPSASFNSNSPSNIFKRHFEHITDGEYDAAYRLFSSSYKSSISQASWTAQPAAAQPYVNVLEAGPTRFEGNGIAYVHVTFFGHDRNDTGHSDTLCNRFVGDVRMVKENGAWRYDPGGNDLVRTPLNPTLSACNP